MTEPQPTIGVGPARSTAAPSVYKLSQAANLPVSLEMEFNMPPGTDPCDHYSIQGHLNSAAGETYTARDLLERLFLNDGAPYRSSLLDNPDQKLSAADRERLTKPESLAALGKLVSNHNGGALITGELTFEYRTYLYTCYQQKVEQGLIKENPNKEILNMLYRFYTHGPQGRRPYIKVPVRELANLANEILAEKTAPPAKPAKTVPVSRPENVAAQPKPAPVRSEPKPPIQPVVVDKPAAKPAAPVQKPAADPFMPF